MKNKTPDLVVLVWLVGRKVPSRSPALFTVVDKCVLSVTMVGQKARNIKIWPNLPVVLPTWKNLWKEKIFLLVSV